MTETIVEQCPICGTQKLCTVFERSGGIEEIRCSECRALVSFSGPTAAKAERLKTLMIEKLLIENPDAQPPANCRRIEDAITIENGFMFLWWNDEWGSTRVEQRRIR